ncbi:glutathione S-transferase family protein [Motilimonas pumila]|uniref:Glutathione S-transferase family protein n=1 Tax=Motilimonas pumila TaxID=2303987 RepID=A0A418YHJ6_9GAMM|nr:glutathione S-transferase family protein [Motilimonas pumila]RJG49560.1 glutathione S-transferase family protein [Motilimonas pumila]
MRLHDYLPSGNGYKIRLLQSFLRQPFQLLEYDIIRGETRTSAFLALNPNGKVPVLEISPTKALCESNAILYYLAQTTPYWPVDTWHQAQAMQWLNFEQYSHEPNIATLRFWRKLPSLTQWQQDNIHQKQTAGYAALAVLEQHLGSQDFLVANTLSIADIALYAYTHVASEGGFDLNRFPAVKAWLQRIADHPHYIDIHSREIA